MDLIEHYGGYKAAKEKLKKYELMHQHCLIDEPKELRLALLEYRRHHNKYEEGDKIVFVDEFMHGEIMTVAWVRDGEVWMDEGAKRCTDLTMLRHATPKEVRENKRSEIT